MTLHAFPQHVITVPTSIATMARSLKHRHYDSSSIAFVRARIDRHGNIPLKMNLNRQRRAPDMALRVKGRSGRQKHSIAHAGVSLY
jgi:hypothetical protein